MICFHKLAAFFPWQPSRFSPHLSMAAVNCGGKADAHRSLTRPLGRRDVCPTFLVTKVQGFKARSFCQEKFHPDPLPRGERTAMIAALSLKAACINPAVGLRLRLENGFPSPAGRRPGKANSHIPTGNQTVTVLFKPLQKHPKNEAPPAAGADFRSDQLRLPDQHWRRSQWKEDP